MASFFDKILGNSGLGGLLSGVGSVASGIIGAVQTKKMSKHLTGAQREANAFSASEAEKNRNFQAQEAQIARDWQEEQYLKYNSPSAQVSQYQDAGINPALMFGGSATPAATSTSAPSGSAAGSVSPSTPDPTAWMEIIPGMAKLAAEIKNINADTRQKNAAAEGGEISNKFQPELLKTQLESGHIGVANARVGLEAAQKNLTLLDKEIESKDANIALTREQTNKVMADASKVEIEKVTETLTQQKIIAETMSEEQRSQLIAAQILVENARECLTRSEAALADANAESVRASTAEQNWRNQFIKDTGHAPGEGLGQFLTNILSPLVTEGLEIAGENLTENKNAFSRSMWPVLLRLYFTTRF